MEARGAVERPAGANLLRPRLRRRASRCAATHCRHRRNQNGSLQIAPAKVVQFGVQQGVPAEGGVGGVSRLENYYDQTIGDLVPARGLSTGNLMMRSAQEDITPFRQWGQTIIDDAGRAGETTAGNSAGLGYTAPDSVNTLLLMYLSFRYRMGEHNRYGRRSKNGILPLLSGVIS